MKIKGTIVVSWLLAAVCFLFTLNSDVPLVLALISFAAAIGITFLLAPLTAELESLKRLQDAQEKEAETLQKKIRRNKSRADYFETVLQNSKDPLFTTDKENLILKFNQGATELFGWEQLDVVGRPVENLFRDKKELGRLLRKVEARGQANTLDIRVFTRDARILHVSLSVSKMENPASSELAGLVFGCQDISRRKVIEREMRNRADQLETLSMTDDLTGLWNSRKFHDDLRKHVGASRENPGRILTMMVMDLDKFKALNDTQGHDAGDEALRHFSEALQASIRTEMDPSYRYGGDEFIILLPDADTDQALRVAERIRHKYSQIKDSTNPTTASIGVVTYNGAEDKEEFFRRADAAMYQSKKKGGNCVSVAERADLGN